MKKPQNNYAFIDSHSMGHMIDRMHRELSDEDSTRIGGIASRGCMLTPGRYVGVEDIEGEDGPFEEKMARLTAKLEEQPQESAKLQAAIRENLKEVWHG